MTHRKADTPAATAKFEQKLADVDRRVRKRAKRVAAMTPEERLRHDEWHRTHQPGDTSVRRAAKHQAEQNAATRALIANDDAVPASFELDELRAALADVRHQIAEAERPASNEDVFS